MDDNRKQQIHYSDGMMGPPVGIQQHYQAPPSNTLHNIGNNMAAPPTSFNQSGVQIQTNIASQNNSYSAQSYGPPSAVATPSAPFNSSGPPLAANNFLSNASHMIPPLNSINPSVPTQFAPPGPPPSINNTNQFSGMLPPPISTQPGQYLPPPPSAMQQQYGGLNATERPYAPVGISSHLSLARPPSLNLTHDLHHSNDISFGPGSTTSPHTGTPYVQGRGYVRTANSNLPPPQQTGSIPPGQPLTLKAPPAYLPDNTDHYKPDRIQASDYGLTTLGESVSPASQMKRSMARIPPDQMPRPDKGAIDVVYHTRSGSGRRNPPNSNTLYCAVDTGNCTPRHMRITTVAPPTTAALLRQSALPFSIISTPFANPENGESEIPLVDMTELVRGGVVTDTPFPTTVNMPKGAPVITGPTVQTPPRCSRCKGYVNPNVLFTDEGRKWTCNLCTMVNPVPDWYYCPLDVSGQRHDRKSRPELQLGSVEFNVGKEYCVRPLQEPIYIFAVDISDRALGNGSTMASLRAIHTTILRLREIEAEHRNHLTRDYSAQQNGGNTSTNMNSNTVSSAKLSAAFNGFSPSNMTAGNVNNMNQFFPPQTQSQSQSQSQQQAMQQPHHEGMHPANMPINRDEPEYEIRVGIVTFNHQIQFYSVNDRPHAPDSIKITVADSSDCFAVHPPSQWLYSVSKQYELLEKLISRLPNLIVSLQGVTNLEGYNTRSFNGIEEENQSCPAAVIKTVQCCLEKHGGRLYVLTTSHSTVGIGKIPKFRENISHYQGSNELSLYGATSVLANGNTTTLSGTMHNAAAALVGATSKPTVQQSQQEELKLLCETYTQLSADCARSMLCVNVYALVGESVPAAPYFDTALIAEPVTSTGGRLYMFPGNMVNDDQIDRLGSQLVSDVEIVRGSEAVTKLRTSIGVRPDGYVGQGVYSDVMDHVEFCSVDSNTSFMFNLKHDSAIKDEEKVHIQLATLYTNAYKQRVVRIHNLTLFASDKINAIFRNVDSEAVMAAMIRTTLHYALHNPLTADLVSKGPRAWCQERAFEMLYAYRIHCSSATPKGQLILPESLKALPLYLVGFLKHASMIENRITNSGLSGSATPITPNVSNNNLAAQRGIKGSSVGSNLNLLSLNREVTGSLVQKIPVRGFERACEIRKLLNLPIVDLINMVYPRMYCLTTLFLESHFDCPLVISTDSVEGYDGDGDGGSNQNSPSRFQKPSAGFNQQSILNTNPLTPLYNNNNMPQQKSSFHQSQQTQKPYSVNMDDEVGHHSMGEHCVIRKDQLRLMNPLCPSSSLLCADHIFVLDDRTTVWFYIGRNVTQEQIESVFCIDPSNPYDRSDSMSFNLNTNLGTKTSTFVSLLREKSVYKQDVRIIWADSRNDNPMLTGKFHTRLVEDGLQGVSNFSYTEYLCALHAKITTKMGNDHH